MCLAIFLLFILLIGLLLFIYYYMFYSPKGIQNQDDNIPPGEQYQACKELTKQLIREFHDIPFEDITITSFDGLKLHGVYHETRKDAPVAICCHGYRGTAVRDFCGGAQLAIEEGQNVLVICERGCGQSEGHTISFGINEEKDCLSWVEYVRARFGEDIPIFLYGISMGAFIVLKAGGNPALPDNIKGIIADCPYNSPKDIICTVGKSMRLPMELIYPFVRLSAFLFGRFRLEDKPASEAAKAFHFPVLIIHGEDDRFVPCAMSKAIADANPEWIQRVTFPGAGHGLSFMVDRPKYHRLVRDLIQRTK